MINYLVVILLFLTAFHVFTQYTRKGRIINRLPGPYAYPIVGNALTLNTTYLHELWNVMRKISETYYPITRVWLFHIAVVNLRHPDDAEILMTNQNAIDKGFVYNYLHPWLKTGLLTSTGDKWRQRRKILTPAFHFNTLKKYLEIINEEGQKCMLNLKSEEKETIKSLMPFCSKFTLNVICELLMELLEIDIRHSLYNYGGHHKAIFPKIYFGLKKIKKTSMPEILTNITTTEAAMGVSLDTMDDKAIAIYKKAIYDFGYVVVYRILRPYIRDWVLALPWKIGSMQRNAVKVLHSLTDNVVKERRAYHQDTQNKYLRNLDDPDKDAVNVSHRKRLAMLDLLLAVEQEGLIDDDGIKEEVNTFTLGGHDTTATALTFTLLLLAENVDAQDKARVEVTELMDRTEGKLEIANLQELSYLERCIKESLRLYPPVPAIFRYIAEDLQLKHGLIPGGTDIIFQIFDLHRDPNFWPEPEKFDPDRFLAENSNNRHPFAYMPFSAGPRNCIGHKFGMLELKATVARILYDFELIPIDRRCDVKLIAHIVLRSLNPIHIKFVKIEK